MPPPKKCSAVRPAGVGATSRASVCQLDVAFHASGAASVATTAPSTSSVSSAGDLFTRATTSGTCRAACVTS